jgi:hypothetical protein
MVAVKLVRSVKNKILYYLFGTVVLASLWLAIVGEFETMLAWWLSIGLLLPPLLWAARTPYVALKTICGVSFITQFVTLPYFYLNRDHFAWRDLKPFNFTAWECFPILAKVSLFLFALILFFKWFYPIAIFGGPSRNLSKTSHQAAAVEYRQIKYSIFGVKNNKNTFLCALLIVLLIALLTPLNLWAYSQGINLVGVEPPRLPYRLSGIVHYLTKFISPLLLAYLYCKTKRGWFLVLLFLAYAWLLGMCTVSKGSVMIIMMPVLGLAWVEKRKLIFVVAGIGTSVGFEFAALARGYVYFVSGGKSGADTSFSIFTLISNVFADSDRNILSLFYLASLLNGILSRIEGFQNLVMAQYYNPDNVIGAWGFTLRMIWRPLVYFDTNLHSIEWQGNTLTVGFYNGGSLLSNAVIVGNSGLLWILLSALVAAILLIIVEKSSDSLESQFKRFKILKVPIIVVITLIFFTGSSGAVIFVLPLLSLYIVSWLGAIVVKKVGSSKNLVGRR